MVCAGVATVPTAGALQPSSANAGRRDSGETFEKIRTVNNILIFET